MALYGLSDEGLQRVKRAVEIVEGRIEDPAPKIADSRFSVQLKMAIADTDVAVGGSGTFSWHRSLTTYTTEVDTGRDYTAYDWLQAGFSAGDRALLIRPIPSPRWYAIKPSNPGDDKYVAVRSSDPPAYLIDQCQDYKSTGAYDANWAIPVWQDIVDNTASTDVNDVKVKWYAPTSGIPNWSTYTTGNIFLGATSTGLTWVAGADEKVKVSSDETAAQYLADQFENVDSTAYSAAYDPQVNFDTQNAGGNESLRAYINASNITNWSSADRLLGQKSTGMTWFAIADPSTYGSNEDLLVKHHLYDMVPGFNVWAIRSFIEASTITGHTTVGQRYLGVNDGVWQWMTGTTGAAGTDELVKVSSGDTAAGYLSKKLYDANNAITDFTTQYDLTIVGAIRSTGGNEDIQLYMDASAMEFWSTADGQFIGHSSTGTAWIGLENEATYDSYEDLKLHHQLFDSTGGYQKLRTFIQASTLAGHTTAGVKYLGISGGTWQWLSGTTAGGADELVKVSADETAAQYLAQQFQAVNTGTTFSATQDIEVQFEILSTGADESMRAFVNASTVPSWDSGYTQLLGHSSGTMKWFTPTPFDTYASGEDLQLDWSLSSNQLSLFVDARSITSYTTSGKRALGIINGAWQFVEVSTAVTSTGGGTDELVKVSADETAAQYLAQQFARVDSTAYAYGEDLDIDWQVNGGGADEQMQGFVNLSNVARHNTAYDQFLGHAGGTAQFFRPEPTDSYDAGQDLFTDWSISSGIVRTFIDANAITSYTTSGKRALGIINGAWQFVEVSTAVTSTGGGTDELVKVSSDETAAQYLAQQFQGVNASSTYNSMQDLPVVWDILSTGADESMQGFVNLSAVTNWSSTYTQLLGQSSGTVKFLQPYPFDTYVSGEDLYLDWMLDGSYLRPFIDAATLPGYTAAAKRGLGIDGGVWQWIEVSTGAGSTGAGLDEKVKISSDETAAQYLQEQFENVNASSTYNSMGDVAINWDVLSTGSTESMRAFVNFSAQTNYSSTATQLLGHSSGTAGFYTVGPVDSYDATEDLILDWRLTGTTLQAWIDADAITSYTTSGKRGLGINNGSWQWIEVSTGGATDEKVKVSSDETAAQYLADQFQGVNATAAYNSSGDYLVEFDVLSTGADEYLRAFIDISDIYRYSGLATQWLGHLAGQTQFMQPDPQDTYVSGQDLGCDWSYSSGIVRAFIDASAITSHSTSARRALGINADVWTFLDITTGTDEKVKVSADETAPQYLQDQFQNVNAASTYASGADIDINWDVVSTGADESLRAFVNLSDQLYYGSTKTQLLGHSSGAAQLIGFTPQDTYDSSEDLAIDWSKSGANMLAFIDADAITSWTSSGKRALGVNNGIWNWIEVSTGGAGSTDTYKVMVSSNDTEPNYLQSKLVNNSGTILFTSQVDYEIKWDTLYEGTTEALRGYVDVSDFPGYNSSYRQLLGHLTGGNKYFIDTDVQTRGTTFDSSEDLRVSNYLGGATTPYELETFVDADIITGYSTAGLLCLGVDDASWKFMSPYPRAVQFGGLASDLGSYINCNTTEKEVRFSTADYGNPTSGSHGFTLTSSGEVYFHRAGLYVLHFWAGIDRTASTEIVNVIYQADIWTGAAWGTRPARSGYSLTLPGSTAAGTRNNCGSYYTGQVMYSFSTGYKLRFVVQAQSDATTNDPAQAVHLDGPGLIIWRAST